MARNNRAQVGVQLTSGPSPTPPSPGTLTEKLGNIQSTLRYISSNLYELENRLGMRASFATSGDVSVEKDTNVSTLVESIEPVVSEVLERLQYLSQSL